MQDSNLVEQHIVVTNSNTEQTVSVPLTVSLEQYRIEQLSAELEQVRH